MVVLKRHRVEGMPMKTHSWTQFKNRMSPERRAKIAKRVDTEIRAINLRRLREELGATQVEAAEKANLAQSELSRLENAVDYRLSTLRRYVKAMGGELEVVAVVKGKRIPLHGV
jgi:predicted transcriptional regulator